MGTDTISITPHIIRTNGQISHLKPLHTVHIESFVDDSPVRREFVAFAGRHAAGSEGVPGCFDVALDYHSFGH